MLGSTTSSTAHSASPPAQDCDSGIKEKTTPNSHISLFSKAPYLLWSGPEVVLSETQSGKRSSRGCGSSGCLGSSTCLRNC